METSNFVDWASLRASSAGACAGDQESPGGDGAGEDIAEAALIVDDQNADLGGGEGFGRVH